MPSLFYLPREQPLDANGATVPGAKANFYVAGTSTPLNTYSDEDLTTPNANPVVADAAGRFGPIWLSDVDYKLILTDADDVTIYTQDPVRGAAGASEATQNQVDARTASDVFVSPRRIADGVGLQGSSIASAGALTLPAIGDYFTVTGTTTITSISERRAGAEIDLLFTGACQLTYDGSSLILLTGDSFTTAAGDVLRFRSEGSGDWRQVGHSRASGVFYRKLANTALSSTAVALTFPKGTTRVDIALSGVSLNGATALVFHLGDAGGTEGTGYLSTSASIFGASSVAASASSSSFKTESASAAAVFHGVVSFQLVDPATFLWAVSGSVANSNTSGIDFYAGAKALSEELTTIVVTGANGTSTFDGGSVSAIYG